VKKILIAAAVAAACAAAPAAAQMYLGGGVGASRTDTDETSYKLYGGYQFNPNWGAELAYNDLGRYRNANIESWTLAGVGTLPLTAQWSLLGKLGLASNRSRFAGTTNYEALLVGVGVGYSFTKQVGLRLEYEDFGKLSNQGGGNSRGSNLSLSLRYAF